MVVRLPLASALAVTVCLILAGCSVLGPGSVDPVPRLSRHLSVNLDADASAAGMGPAEVLEEHGSVGFDYTHAGDAIDPAQVDVGYTGADGEPVKAKLSEFTDEAEVGAGDIVHITPGEHGTDDADLLTAMTVELGGTTLAERAAGDRSWFKAGGAPIPLAFSEEGTLSWDIHAEGGFDLHVEGFRTTSTEERCTYDWESEDPYAAPSCEPHTTEFSVRQATIGVQETVEGTFSAISSLPPQGPRLSFASSWSASASAQVDVDVVDDGEPFAGTIDGSLTGEVESAEVALQFDAGHELRSITTQAKGVLDGQVEVTGDFAPGPELDHPIESVDFGPETEEVDPGQAPEEMVGFLSRAWGLDLAVGDELAFDMGMDGRHSRFVSQVLAKEERSVGGSDRMTYKLSDLFVLDLAPLEPSGQGFSYDYTYWIDAETFTPIYMQGDLERTFDREELHRYIETVRDLAGDDGTEIHLPDEASFTLRLESTLELVESSSDLAMSPILGAAGVRLVPFMSASILLGGPSFGLPFAGGESYDEEVPEPAPAWPEGGCPDPHWHATFGIFLPGPTGEPTRVDFSAPRSSGGQAYYDFSNQAENGMTIALHMHQQGEEAGSAALGPSQWHLERAGQCIQVQEALGMVDVEAYADLLILGGAHEQVAGQSGTFAASDEQALRWWLQTQQMEGEWLWQEVRWDDVGMHDLQDGESLLVALGSYSEAQVATMQAAVPPPVSRI